MSFVNCKYLKRIKDYQKVHLKINVAILNIQPKRKTYKERRISFYAIRIHL